jgi:chromosomal replication initiation ATPase DnaA
MHDYYEIPENDLYKSKRGARNEPRAVAVSLIKRCRRESLKEIGNLFKMEKYSSVSSIIERFKKQLRVDRSLGKCVDECYLMIIKSQEQT